MTFFQRLLILLVTPILAQFIFAIVLLGAYRTSEEIIYKDLAYKTQTAELMKINIQTYKAGGLLATFGFTGDQSILPLYDKLAESITRKTENLLLVLQGKQSAHAGASIVQAVKRLSETKQQLANNLSQFHNNAMLAFELRRELEDALVSLEALIDERSAEGSADSKSIERSHWIFVSCVVGGFAANMLMSAILLLMFTRDFGLRFNTIVDNTKRLSDGRALNNQLSGKDELAELDRVFHEMNDSLKATEKRKEQLVQMVSHDLRNPLAALSVSLDCMGAEAYGKLTPELSERVKSGQRAVKRLTGLVNDILDLEKLRAGKLKLTMSIVEAQGLVEECFTELKSIAEKAEVSLSANLSDLYVVADKERLSQILINLIGNALKFSPRGGTVTVSAELLSEGDSRFIKFVVTDTGPGVPAEYAEFIFLPFEQIPDGKRPKTGSTGLGLPICKMLIELHGGTIGVESDSTGSRFWFTLAQEDIDEV